MDAGDSRPGPESAGSSDLMPKPKRQQNSDQRQQACQRNVQNSNQKQAGSKTKQAAPQARLQW
jgi:hypothetical protein